MQRRQSQGFSKAFSKFAAIVGGLFAMALALAAAPASAQSVEEFYQGQTFTVYVGFPPGGGYDTYARSVARHIGKHIPGNPSVIVVNRPGAGSMLLTNELYNILPKDGTAIGLSAYGMPTEPLFGAEEAKYDPRRFNWLGSANKEASICVTWHTSPVKKWQDMLTTELTMGASGPGGETFTHPRIINHVLGTKMKVVSGYPGGSPINLAIERGEVDGRCGLPWSSAKAANADWLNEGKVNILLQMATAKHDELQDVPVIMELAKTQEDKDALELLFAALEFGRAFVAPPEVPADRVAALRNAFMATMHDPEFLAEAEKQNLEVNPVDGERIEELINRIYAAPPEIVQLAKEMTGR